MTFVTTETLESVFAVNLSKGGNKASRHEDNITYSILINSKIMSVPIKVQAGWKLLVTTRKPSIDRGSTCQNQQASSIRYVRVKGYYEWLATHFTTHLGDPRSINSDSRSWISCDSA